MNNDILSKLGITLNAMQEATADAILHTNKDVVVLSPTGSGKTYAYLLPLIQRLDASSDALQAVVLVPGRELALQSANVLHTASGVAKRIFETLDAYNIRMISYGASTNNICLLADSDKADDIVQVLHRSLFE